MLSVVGTALWIAAALAITFCPSIYALIRKRPGRAAAYFVISLIGFGLSVFVAPWWTAQNPTGDWEFASPGSLYYGLSWPVTTAAAWGIAAISDTALAVEKRRAD